MTSKLISSFAKLQTSSTWTTKLCHARLPLIITPRISSAPHRNSYSSVSQFTFTAKQQNGRRRFSAGTITKHLTEAKALTRYSQIRKARLEQLKAQGGAGGGGSSIGSGGVGGGDKSYAEHNISILFISHLPSSRTYLTPSLSSTAHKKLKPAPQCFRKFWSPKPWTA